MLHRINRLRLAADVQRVRRQGRSWHHPLFVLLLLPNDLAVSRFGFVASRRVGNAVVRNRIKRLLRETIRRDLSYISTGWDFLFVARQPMATADLAETQTAVRQLLQRAGVWSANGLQNAAQ